jgi:hypothetical protein
MMQGLPGIQPGRDLLLQSGFPYRHGPTTNKPRTAALRERGLVRPKEEVVYNLICGFVEETPGIELDAALQCRCHTSVVLPAALAARITSAN